MTLSMTDYLTATDTRTVTAGGLASYRQAVRAAGLPVDPEHGAVQVSPVYPFVLCSAAADKLVERLRDIEAGPSARVHLSQEIRLRRPLRPGARVTATAELVAARREPSGTRVTLRSVLADDAGEVHAELLTGALLIGACSLDPFGEQPAGSLPTVPGDAAKTVVTRELSTGYIRDYAEASGDANPIHLDHGAATRAGFPGVIAHGMSVVALVCEEIADHYADVDTARITGVGARFSSPVPAGEPIEIALRRGPAAVAFGVRTSRGLAVKSGWVTLSGVDGHDG